MSNWQPIDTVPDEVKEDGDWIIIKFKWTLGQPNELVRVAPAKWWDGEIADIMSECKGMFPPGPCWCFAIHLDHMMGGALDVEPVGGELTEILGWQPLPAA